MTATLLPHELHHGVDLTARIKPVYPEVPGQPTPRHYYRMSLGPYDTMQARRPAAPPPPRRPRVRQRDGERRRAPPPTPTAPPRVAPTSTLLHASLHATRSSQH